MGKMTLSNLRRTRGAGQLLNNYEAFLLRRGSGGLHRDDTRADRGSGLHKGERLDDHRGSRTGPANDRERWARNTHARRAPGSSRRAGIQ